MSVTTITTPWKLVPLLSMEQVKASSPSSTEQPKQRPGSAKKPSHARRKRPPKRLSQRPNDVYINRSSQFAGQLSRCRRLFDQGYREITVHGLGAAIHRAINLALQLRDTAPYTLTHHTTTSTVQLVDDLEPLTDDADYKTQSRPSSAIHIQLSRASPPPSHPTTPPQHQATPTQHQTTSTQHQTTPIQHQATPTPPSGRRKSSSGKKKASSSSKENSNKTL